MTGNVSNSAYSIAPAAGKVKQNLSFLAKIGETDKKYGLPIGKIANERGGRALNSQLMPL